MILVDTSVLIDFLRGKTTPPVSRLVRLEEEGTPYAIPMICCQEVVQGAKDEREWTRLRHVLLTQQLIVPEDPVAVHWDAARIFFDCRRRGLTPRSSVDCYIAATTLAMDGTLLHDDDDFDSIAKVRPLKTLRA